MIKQLSSTEIFKILSQFSENLQKSETIKDLINEVKSIFKQIYPSHSTCFYMVDRENNKLNLSFFQSSDSPETTDHDFTYPNWIIDNKKPLLISDIKNEKLGLSGINESGSRVFVPVFSNKKVVGVLRLSNQTINAFDSIHIESLNFIGIQIGAVLHALSASETYDVNKSEIEILERDKNRSELLLSVLKQTSLDGVVIINKEGIIIDWNPVSENIFGFKKEEVLGQNLSDSIIPKQHRAAHHKGMDTYNKTGHGPVLGKRIEITAIKKNGEEIPVELSINELVHFGETMFIGFLRDISGRIQNEKRIKAGRQRLVNILQNIGEGVIVADSDEKIIVANPLSERLLGLAESPLLQQLHVIFQHCIEKPELLLNGIKNNEMNQIEINIRENSKIRILNLISTWFADTENYRKGYIITLIDITKEKEAERLKNEFIGNISHEFRTPLTSIIGFAEIMANDPEINQATVSEFSSIIKNEGSKLVDTIENVMLFSKLESGNLKFIREKTSVTQLLEKAISKNSLLLTAKGQTVSFNRPEKEIYFNADSNYLSDAVSKLIDNSIKFSPEKAQLLLTCSVIENELKISLSDPGSGINENDIPFLFDKFYRSETQKRISRGTGLGLPIVKKIVDAHEGQISIQSNKNSGTEITLIFKI